MSACLHTSRPRKEALTQGLRNIGLSLLSSLGSFVTSFAHIVFTTRTFEKEQVALLAYTGILTALMDASKGLGLGTVLLRKLPKLPASQDSEACSLALSYMIYSLLPSLVLALVVVALAPWLSQHGFGSNAWRQGLRLCAITAVFSSITSTNMLVTQANQQFGTLAAMSALTGSLQRLGPCLIVGTLGGSIETFLGYSVIGAALASIATLWPVRSIFRTRGVRIAGPREVWDQSRHFYYTNLFRYGATQIDQLLVAALFSPSMLAVYYMLRRLYSLALVLIGSLMDALVPGLSQQAGQDPDGARNRLQLWRHAALYGGTIGAATFAGNAPELVNAVLGHGYGDDTLLIALFAISAVVYFLFGFLQTDIVLFGRPESSLELGVVTAVVNTAAGIALARVVGVHALPAAMAVSYLVGIELLRRRGLIKKWDWRPPMVAIAVTGLVAFAGVAADRMGGGATPRLFVVNSLIAGFAWTQYRRWQVGECFRQIS